MVRKLIYDINSLIFSRLTSRPNISLIFISDAGVLKKSVYCQIMICSYMYTCANDKNLDFRIGKLLKSLSLDQFSFKVALIGIF